MTSIRYITEAIVTSQPPRRDLEDSLATFVQRHPYDDRSLKMTSPLSPPITALLNASHVPQAFQAISPFHASPKAASRCHSSQPADPEPIRRLAVQPPRSCIVCKSRKVKCDKNHPCSTCTKARIECIYPPITKRRPRGRGKQKTQDDNPYEFKRRLARLESILEELRGHVKSNDTCVGP